jgi:hypothetical protein
MDRLTSDTEGFCFIQDCVIAAQVQCPNLLPEVIQGVEFKDGIKQLQNAA